MYRHIYFFGLERQQVQTLIGDAFQCHMCPGMVACNPAPYRDAIDMMETEQQGIQGQQNQQMMGGHLPNPQERVGVRPGSSRGSHSSAGSQWLFSDTDNEYYDTNSSRLSSTTIRPVSSIGSVGSVWVVPGTEPDPGNNSQQSNVTHGSHQSLTTIRPAASISPVESVWVIADTGPEQAHNLQLPTETHDSHQSSNAMRPLSSASSAMWVFSETVSMEPAHPFAPTPVVRSVVGEPPTRSRLGRVHTTPNGRTNIQRNTYDENSMRPGSQSSTIVFQDPITGEVLMAPMSFIEDIQVDQRQRAGEAYSEASAHPAYRPFSADLYNHSTVQPSAPTPEPLRPLTTGSIWVTPETQARAASSHNDINGELVYC